MNELMQNVVVLLVVGLAVAYLGRLIYKTFAGKKDCGCGSCSHINDMRRDWKSIKKKNKKAEQASR